MTERRGKPEWSKILRHQIHWGACKKVSCTRTSTLVAEVGQFTIGLMFDLRNMSTAREHITAALPARRPCWWFGRWSAISQSNAQTENTFSRTSESYSATPPSPKSETLHILYSFPRKLTLTSSSLYTAVISWPHPIKATSSCAQPRFLTGANQHGVGVSSTENASSINRLALVSCGTLRAHSTLEGLS